MKRCIAIVPILLACGPVVKPGAADADGETSTSSSASTSGPSMPATTSTAAEPASTSTGAVSTESSHGSTNDDPTSADDWLQDPDVGTGDPGDVRCSPWEQDCPAGEQCKPWANDGSNVWNATHCSPIASDPVGPANPCIVEDGVASGVDNCGEGLLCWDVDPETLVGQCRLLCTGSPDDPTCPLGACMVTNEGTLTLCLTTCDPLEPSCGVGDSCRLVEGTWFCLPDGAGVVTQDGLMPTLCPTGETAIDASTASFCEADADLCCAQICDVNAPACAPPLVCVAATEGSNPGLCVDP